MNLSGILNRDSFNVVMDRIQNASVKSGRLAEEIQIVAVTKTFGIETIESALNFGIKCIGENRVQEIEKKIPLIKNRKNTEIHFIGHLKSNKVRKVLSFIDVIETVDSLKIANRINLVSKELKKKTPVYLQINTGKDPAKHGFNINEIMKAAEEINCMKNILLSGIMTVPPFIKEHNILTAIFQKTKEVRDNICEKINPNCKKLSMGMSNDYEIAIENGATHIRIGTILFGNRKQ